MSLKSIFIATSYFLATCQRLCLLMWTRELFLKCHGCPLYMLTGFQVAKTQHWGKIDGLLKYSFPPELNRKTNFYISSITSQNIILA